MDDLTELVADWPVGTVAVGVTSAHRTLGVGGDPSWQTRIASVAKLLVGVGALVALEEETTTLGAAAGPEGSTVEHLLAHTSGLAFDSHQQLAAAGTRRIYSNTGIEVFAEHLEERSGMPVGDYLQMGVFEPLGLGRTYLDGSPAHHIWSTVDDLLVFCREVMTPTLVTAETMADATRVHFGDVSGVVPGVGSFDPNPWGLTFEIRGDKQPHWTGAKNSPRTVGHFGGSGSFLWVDPDVGVAAVAITDRDFDAWALEAWPRFSDAVLDRYARASTPPAAPTSWGGT